MHNNEFERQVQQKTEGLKITPSEGLWDAIEGQLPPEKKRRRPLLWLLLGVLLAGGAASWFMVGRHDKALDIPVAQAKQQPDSSGSLSASDVKQTLSNNQSQPLPQPISDVEQQGKRTNSMDSNATQQQIINYKRKGSKHIQITQPLTDDTASVDVTDMGAAKKIKSADNQFGKPQWQGKERRLPFATHTQTVLLNVTTAQTDTIGLETELITAALPDLAAPFFSTITVSPNEADASLRPKLTVPISQLNVPLQAVAPTNKAKRRWELGVSLGAGMSNRSELFQFSATQDEVLSVLNPIGLPVVGGVSTIGYGSPTKAGLAFNAGLYLHKQIGKRWFVQTGLAYHYLSSKQSVGSFVKDSVRRLILVGTVPGSLGTFNNSDNIIEYTSFYRFGNSSVYTNRIHLIQLPIELQYRFGKHQKLGLHTGLALGYLMQSKLLLYDGANANYFTNREAMSRMQLSLQTGAAFYPKPQSSMAIGLRFNYNVNSFVKKQIKTQNILSGLLYCNIPLKRK